MSNLVINTEQNRVYIPKGFEYVYDLGSIECAIGNIIDVLECEFPAENYSAENTVNRIREKIAGKTTSKTLWGIKENGFTIQAIHIFLSGRDKIDLTMQELEEFRINYGLSIKHTPLNLCDIDKGLQIKNATSILDIVFHLLYFYTLNKMKLVKCEHCGRWFATSTLKVKYCSRKSVFTGYTHLNCEQAVRNINQELGRNKKRIYNSLTAYYPSNDDTIYSFLDRCAEYRENIKVQASVKNLSAYWDFLKKYKGGVNNGNDK